MNGGTVPASDNAAGVCLPDGGSCTGISAAVCIMPEAGFAKVRCRAGLPFPRRRVSDSAPEILFCCTVHFLYHGAFSVDIPSAAALQFSCYNVTGICRI
ncbi:MAG: hypothetical protein CW338_12280 [Clostridiales bacterium]|nr:hypothetical protein [Clostridiales bacterium]